MRLTPLGRVVAIVAVAAVVAGIALGATAVLVVGMFLLLLTALAMLLVAEVPEVSISRQAAPPEVARGAPAEIRLRFRSLSNRRARPVTIIEMVDGSPRVATIGPFTPQGNDRITYAVTTERRGEFVTGPLTIRRFDPFGLASADRRYSAVSTVRVRPRVFPLRMLPSGRRRDLEGPTRERSEGSGTFHQLRQYQPGDDLRRVHWKSTARTGELLVKQLIDTTRPELMVLVDNRATTIGDADFEEAVDVAASIVAAAEAEEFPTTLLLADGSSGADLDGQPIPPIDRLTAVQRAEVDAFAEVADAVRGRGRSLVVISGEPSDDDLAVLTKLARGFSPAYLVSVAAERQRPLAAPHGMQPVACSDAADFANQWGLLR